ncbi:MAG: hypothetical protein ABIL09_23120 [Gemmatimonadota bacterium]
MGGLATFVEQTSSTQWRLGNEAFEMVVERDAGGTPVLARWVLRARPELDWASRATVAPGVAAAEASASTRAITCGRR